MKNLYKGRYMIAVYDEEDCLIDVGFNIKELLTCKKPSIFRSNLSRHLNGKRKNRKIYLIDLLENHNDCFCLEDKVFLKEFEEDFKTDNQRAEELGVSLRTYYRYKAKERKKNESKSGL